MAFFAEVLRSLGAELFPEELFVWSEVDKFRVARLIYYFHEIFCVSLFAVHRQHELCVRLRADRLLHFGLMEPSAEGAGGASLARRWFI